MTSRALPPTPEQAAELYGEMGARPDEAIARLRSGQRLAADDRAEEASAQLLRARAFFAEVNATHYLAQIDDAAPS